MLPCSPRYGISTANWPIPTAERQSGKPQPPKAVNGLEAAYSSRPMTAAEIRRFLRSIGMSAAELRRCLDLHALCERWGDDRIIPLLAREGVQASERASHRAVRSLKRITALADGKA